jgi:hypothetical protein
LGLTDHVDARVCELGQEDRSLVGGTVVNDDQLKVRVRLGDNRAG